MSLKIPTIKNQADLLQKEIGDLVPKNISDNLKSSLKSAVDFTKNNLTNKIKKGLTQDVPRIMTGARSILRVGGTVIGYAKNVSYLISQEWIENYGIDDSLPVEIIPNITKVKGKLSIFRIPNNSISQQFFISDMFRSKCMPYTTIEIRDRVSDNLIILFPNVIFTSLSESFDNSSITTTELEFISIGWRDETIPKPLINP